MQKQILILLLLLAVTTNVAVAQSVQASSITAFHEIFYAAFNRQRELHAWDKRPSQRRCKVVLDSADNPVLRIRTKKISSRVLEKRLPVAEVAGKKLLVRLRVRANGIMGRTASYKGVKVAIRIISPGGTAYPQLQMPATDIEWQAAGFTAYVPVNASSCTLLLGLEDVQGEAMFDEVHVFSFPTGTDIPAANQAPRDTLPALRGAMISTTASADDLRTLAAWGANHIRWQLTWNGFPDSPADTASLESYRAWLHSTLRSVHALMPLCDSLGLKVVLDLHTLPGGRARNAAGQEHRIFRDISAQAAYREAWREIAGAFRNEPALWGYDLANEPIEGYLPDSILDWQHLAEAVAMDIRPVDSSHYLIVEGAPGGASEVLPGVQPLHTNKVVYSFHMYEPALFTHQGIYGLDTGIYYPGNIGGRYWDKEALQRFLQPVRDWQLRHGCNIYVGEFSAVRWAPDSSAVNYLRDCIDIFESWGWSWAYHAFREWDGWSAEHDGNPEHLDKAAQPTDRELLLKAAFSRNKR